MNLCAGRKLFELRWLRGNEQIGCRTQVDDSSIAWAMRRACSRQAVKRQRAGTGKSSWESIGVGTIGGELFRAGVSWDGSCAILLALSNSMATAAGWTVRGVKC